MNDNLPTMNRLVLLVENAHAPIPNARSAAPSLASLQAAEEVNRPILRLLEPASPAESTTSVSTTIQAQSAADWPCELTMDALKLGRHSATSVRARLARRSYDSRFAAPAGCSTLPSGDFVATSSLFTGTPAAKEGVTALTMGGAVDPATQPGSDRVFLPEMEWATVQWEWPGRPQGATADCGGSISAPRVAGPTSQHPSALSLGGTPDAGNAECGKWLGWMLCRSRAAPQSVSVLLPNINVVTVTTSGTEYEESTDWCVDLPTAQFSQINHMRAQLIHVRVLLVCNRLPSSEEVRPASSKESCCAVCHSTPRCKAGVFVESQCWLKFNLGGGKVSAPGAVSCKLK